MVQPVFNLSKPNRAASARLLILFAFASLSACSDDSSETPIPPFDASVSHDASAQLDAARLDAAVPLIDLCATTDAASRRPPQLALVDSSDAGAFYGSTVVHGSLVTDAGSFAFVDGFAYSDPTIGSQPRAPVLKIALSTSPLPHCQRTALDGDNQAGVLVVLYYSGPVMESFASTSTPLCPGDGWTGLFGGEVAPDKLTLRQGSVDGGSQVVGSVDVFNLFRRGELLGTIDFQLDFCGTLDTARF